MKYSITARDTFQTRQSIMKGKGASIVDEIQWDSLLNHELASEPVFDARGNVIPERQNIVDVESGESLSIMQGRYRVMQPSRFRDMVRESIGDIPHRIVSGGTFNERANMFLSVELTGLSDFSVGNERHKSFQHFGGSANGSHANFQLSDFMRLACFNRYAAIYTGSNKAKNTENGEAKFATILSQIDSIIAAQVAYAAQVERMANERVTHEQARAFIAATVASEVAKVLSPQAVTLADEIHRLFRSGIANHGQTRADLFNGFTEYYTHNASKKSSDVFGNALLGKAADVKRDVFRALGPVAQFKASEFNARVSRGKSLLATV